MRAPKFAIRKLSAGFSMLFFSLVLIGQAQAQRGQVTYEEKRRQANDIAVSIVVSGLSCTCARFAEDIRNVINDLRPDGIRVLPVLGVGGLQNLNDVLFLKGIDMGVVDEDNLQLLKKRNPQLYANIEQRVQYITKLYNSEFHVLARNDIKTYEDLRGKKVNFNQKDSQTEVTADIVFQMHYTANGHAGNDRARVVGDHTVDLARLGKHRACDEQCKKHCCESASDHGALFGDTIHGAKCRDRWRERLTGQHAGDGPAGCANAWLVRTAAGHATGRSHR